MNRIPPDSWIIHKPIAHRGLHTGHIPENSLGAFENAIENKVAIELDVHMIADGTIVVFHDYNTERMTGTNAVIEHLDKQSLRNFKLSRTSYHIPTLDETLSLINGKTELLIEIKTGSYPGKLEKALMQRLLSYTGDYAIQSFSPFSIERVKRLNPQCHRGILASNFKSDGDMAGYKKFVSKNFILNFLARPDFIAYDIDGYPAKKVAAFRTAGMPILSWTVRSREDYKKAKVYSDNIIFEGDLELFQSVF